MFGQNTNLLNPHSCRRHNLTSATNATEVHTMSGRSKVLVSLLPVVLNSNTLRVSCLEGNGDCIQQLLKGRTDLWLVSIWERNHSAQAATLSGV